MDVGVCGGVLAKPLAKAGDDPFEVAFIPEMDEAVGGLAEVEDAEAAAGLGNAVHFAQADVEVGKVAKTVGDGDCIEMLGGLARVESVALEELDVGAGLALP